MRIARNTLSKEYLRTLPSFNYVSRSNILVPKLAKDFKDALIDIQSEKLVGFDIKSSILRDNLLPAGPDIYQFSTSKKTYIFQKSNFDGYNTLLLILTSKDVVKVGFNVNRKEIYKSLGVTLESYKDIGAILNNNGFTGSIGLKAATAYILNRYFHKPIKIEQSNWSSVELTNDQIAIAANDSFAALKIYNEIIRKSWII
jgi:hypothetical protein